MTRPVDEQGLTLVEAVVACALLMTLAGGLATLLVMGRRHAARAELMDVAVAAASARIERLHAVPWSYALDGTAPESAALSASPPGTLERDAMGYVEWLDGTGGAVGAGSGPPRLVCRWAVVSATPAETRGLEACVFPWPAGDGVAPLVCLASARSRQP